MVTGGRADEAGPLGMKRELRALDGEIAQLERRGEEARAELEILIANLRSAEQSLDEVNAQKQVAEREVYSAKHRHEQTQAELARLGLELTLCQSELGRIRQDVENARLRADRAQHQLAAAATSRAEAETEGGRVAEELVQLRGSIQAGQNELGAGGGEVAGVNERLGAGEGGGGGVV